MAKKNEKDCCDYLTQDPVVQAILSKSIQIANTRAPLFITGETGSGKTLLARYLHDQSSHKKAPFIHINCAAIPETLLEAELFGYIKGSFTGAYKDSDGKFCAAGNGTILLDEIGEIPPHLQAKLLKIVDENEFYPVGSNIPQQNMAHIIAATNTDITNAVKIKKFRQDLYFRLNTFELHIPPLRNRQADILLLFNAFISSHIKEKSNLPKVNDQVYDALSAYSWPGNIRELKNLVEAIMIGNVSQIILADLPHYMFDSLAGELIQSASKLKPLENVKKDYAKYIYKISDYNKKKTACILNVDVKTVRKLLL